MRGFEATFSSEGLLTLSGCPPGERREYTMLPSTRGWDEEAKTHEHASYQMHVLKAMKVWCLGRQDRGATHVGSTEGPCMRPAGLAWRWLRSERAVVGRCR